MTLKRSIKTAPAAVIDSRLYTSFCPCNGNLAVSLPLGIRTRTHKGRRRPDLGLSLYSMAGEMA
jgi:hypothetical protein